MTDADFKKHLAILYRTTLKYRLMLQEAVDEYERRFGRTPDEANDTFWTQVFECGDGVYEYKQVLQRAQEANAEVNRRIKEAKHEAGL